MKKLCFGRYTRFVIFKYLLIEKFSLLFKNSIIIFKIFTYLK